MATDWKSLPLEQEDDHGTWRMISYAEGYVMCRRGGCAPTVKSIREWIAIKKEPAP